MNLIKKLFPLQVKLSKCLYRINNSNYAAFQISKSRMFFNSKNEDVKTNLYKMCLANSNKYGWSENNLSVSSNNIGYSPVMGRSIFTNGIIDVVYNLMDQMNNDLSNYYKKLFEIDNSKFNSKYILSEENLYEGLKQRLLNTSPYIKNWGQAIKLGAQPFNISTTISKHIDTVNIILQVSEDSSLLTNEVSILFKASLVKTLIITELFMLTDRSNNFSQTMKLLSQLVSFNMSIFKTSSLIPINFEVLLSLVANSLSSLIPYDLSKVEQILKYQSSIVVEENKNI